MNFTLEQNVPLPEAFTSDHQPRPNEPIAADRLRSFIERIEHLEEEKKALQSDIKEVFAEAKGTGFDVKIMRLILKIRKADADDLAEQEALLHTYKKALGMEPDFEQG